jgi:diaminopropionate ammonia-lyase
LIIERLHLVASVGPFVSINFLVSRIQPENIRGLAEKIITFINLTGSRRRMKLHINDSPRRGQPLDESDRVMFGPGAMPEIRSYMAPLNLQITPLHRMDALARNLGIGALLIKDESSRSSLGSFKALGGAYAVIRLVVEVAERQLGRTVTTGDLNSTPVREIARSMTITCATDGNHGRSVAAGARLTGCRAVIFVHASVSEARVAAIEALGADVRRIDGSYDDAVAVSIREGQQPGWQVVSDTSWPDYEHVPSRVMQGYLLMVDEVVEQCRERHCLPTHVFLQAGVGGLAAAVSAYMTAVAPAVPPRFVVVEPDSAACLFESAREQRRIRIAVGKPTMMSMLECYEPSLVGWRILERLAHAFISIEDAAALRTFIRLARPLLPDPFVLSGESGGAGLAGLIEASTSGSARAQLGIDGHSVALVFNTEGATDPAIYQSLLSTTESALNQSAGRL